MKYKSSIAKLAAPCLNSRGTTGDYNNGAEENIAVFGEEEEELKG